MTVDWVAAETLLMGNAWVGSRASDHVNMLSDSIGVRWAGSAGERRAAEYIRSRFDEYGLLRTSIEEFELKTWEHVSSAISVIGEDDRAIDIRPSLFCTPVDATALLVDAGYGMAHEIEPLGRSLAGSIALVSGGNEPFSPPESLPARLGRLASMGVLACIVPQSAAGRFISHTFAGERSDEDP